MENGIIPFHLKKKVEQVIYAQLLSGILKKICGEYFLRVTLAGIHDEKTLQQFWFEGLYTE
jgi:hypothetical protein